MRDLRTERIDLHEVLAGLQDRTIKGKIRKVRITSQNNGV